MFFTPERIFLIFCIVGGYCFGLIQSAYFFSKIKKINLRYHGSGNYGTTNAWRVLGWQWGILTFICDILKTLLAIYVATKVLPMFPQLSIDEHALVLYTGLGVIIGHIFPVYLKFRGGKGVACAFATIVMLKDIKVLGVAILIFLLVFLISRYVSLASLSMVFFSALTLMVCMLMRWTYVESNWIADCQIVFCVIFLMIMLAHRSNIVQLVFGDERKFYFRKKKRMEAAAEDYLSYDKYTAEVEAGDATSEGAAIVAETAEEVVKEIKDEAEAVEEPAEEAVEEPAEEAVEDLAEETDEEPAEEAEEEPAEEAEEEPAEEAVEEPAEEAEEDPAEEAVEESAEEAVEDLAEEAVEESAEEAVEDLAEETVEEPAEEAVEDLAEEAEEEPIEEAEEEPAEEAVEDPAEEAVEEPAEEAVEDPVEEAVEEPIEEAEEEPIEEAVEEPIEEAVEEPAEEAEEDPAEEAVEEPAEEAVEDLAEETVEEPAEETDEEPVEEAVEETTETTNERLEKTAEKFKDGATVATAAIGGFFSKMKNKVKDFDLAKKIGMTLDSDEEKVEESAEIVEEKIVEPITEAIEESAVVVAEEISEIKENTQE